MFKFHGFCQEMTYDVGMWGLKLKRNLLGEREKENKINC